jgi:hypothetical protein
MQIRMQYLDIYNYASVSELVNEAYLGCVDLNVLRVQVPPLVLLKIYVLDLR